MILGMHDFCTGPNPPGTYMILRPCMIFVNQSPYTIIEKYFLWSKKVGRPKAKCLLTSLENFIMWYHIISPIPTEFSILSNNSFQQVVSTQTFTYTKITSSSRMIIWVLHAYFFWKMFPPCTLIWACTLIFFGPICPPARLLGTTRLLGTPEYFKMILKL